MECPYYLNKYKPHDTTILTSFLLYKKYIRINLILEIFLSLNFYILCKLAQLSEVRQYF